MLAWLLGLSCRLLLHESINPWSCTDKVWGEYSLRWGVSVEIVSDSSQRTDHIRRIHSGMDSEQLSDCQQSCRSLLGRRGWSMRYISYHRWHLLQSFYQWVAILRWNIRRKSPVFSDEVYMHHIQGVTDFQKWHKFTKLCFQHKTWASWNNWRIFNEPQLSFIDSAAVLIYIRGHEMIINDNETRNISFESHLWGIHGSLKHSPGATLYWIQA